MKALSIQQPWAAFIADESRHLNPPECYEPGLIGLVFDRARCRKPIFWKGQLGLFEIDEVGLNIQRQRQHEERNG